MKILWLIGVLLFVSVQLMRAQNISDIEKLLESNDISRSEEGYEEMVNTLVQLQAMPLNINTANFDSLKMLFFLSDSQIDNILAFRKKYGVYLFLNELLLVGGIGRKDVENISPFICVGNVSVKERVRTVKTITTQEIIAKARCNLPLQEGYKQYSPREFKTEEQYLKKVENRFKGSPVGTLLKYKIQVGKVFQAGVTLENDPGEPYFTQYQKTGFDFLSAHLCMTTNRLIRSVIVGDYRLQWGQGLLAWGGFTSGKSSVALGNEKSGKGCAPYTSTDENNFLRGIAFGIQPFPEMTADVFFSYKKTDGNIIQSDTLTAEDFLTATLYQSGYHRNQKECEKKHQLKEMTTGLSVHWNSAYYKIGMNSLYYDFTPEIEIGEELYRRYGDRGKRRFFLSVDYKTGFRNIYLFGETAVTGQKKIATVNGLRFSGSSKVALCVLYRRYDKRYISRYAGGFGEYSNTSNEEGIYWGIAVSPGRNLKINAYYDWFRFFSARYGASIPGDGHEILLEVTYNQTHCDHLFRFKYEEKPEDLKGVVINTTQRRKNEFRYQFTYQFRKSWILKSRCDFSLYHKARVDEKGYMIAQDIIYTHPKNTFKGQFRLAYFDTDTYNTRIYSYENNVLYGYSFPAYFDRGWRTYVNMNWKVSRFATCYLKAGLTVYPNRDYSGSALSKVEGHQLWDIVVQVRLKL